MSLGTIVKKTHSSRKQVVKGFVHMAWEKLERSLRISWENGQPRPIVSWDSQASLRPCGQRLRVWVNMRVRLQPTLTKSLSLFTGGKYRSVWTEGVLGTGTAPGRNKDLATADSSKQTKQWCVIISNSRKKKKFRRNIRRRIFWQYHVSKQDNWRNQDIKLTIARPGYSSRSRQRYDFHWR